MHDVSEKEQKPPKPKKKPLSKGTVWAIKITIIVLGTAFFVSFLTEITATHAGVVISFLVLIFLVLISIAFDAIGVAATSCDPAPLLSMAARKVAGAKNAVMLVKDAGKVSSICGDVIGDMCGIISGACSAAIIIKLVADNPNAFWFSMVMTSVIAAVTIGGKAFFKSVAINNSRDIMLFAGRVVGIFYRPKKDRAKEKHKKDAPHAKTQITETTDKSE